jgi:hypothetical protein
VLADLLESLDDRRSLTRPPPFSLPMVLPIRKVLLGLITGWVAVGEADGFLSLSELPMRLALSETVRLPALTDVCFSVTGTDGCFPTAGAAGFSLPIELPIRCVLSGFI